MRRRGAEEAGAIFIKLNRLDGTGTLYGPAPQTAFERRGRPNACSPRSSAATTPAADADIEARLVKEIRFDPDVWIVEVEDRAGSTFLDDGVHDTV